MSSLAAARADNFYYPKNFDPGVHRTLNKYHKSHALGKRASKLHTKGVIVVRFEIPFKVICQNCGCYIAKGVRFNAEKKKVGYYFSTAIYNFEFKCKDCSADLQIETDPASCQYLCKQNLRRPAETVQEGSLAAESSTEYVTKDQIVVLDDAATRDKRRSNAMYAVEYEARSAKASDADHVLAAIYQSGYDRSYHAYETSRELKGALEKKKAVARRAAAALSKSALYYYGEDLEPESEWDRMEAASVRFSERRAHLQTAHALAEQRIWGSVGSGGRCVAKEGRASELGACEKAPKLDVEAIKRGASYWDLKRGEAAGAPCEGQRNAVRCRSEGAARCKAGSAAQWKAAVALAKQPI